MRRATRRFILAAFTPAFLCLMYAGPGRPSPGPSFDLKAEADGWTIRYLPKHIPSRVLSINGVRHTQFSSVSPAALADSGSPQLPVETVSLGIPFGARISVDLVDPVYRESQNQLVAPVPRYRRTAEGEHIAIYQKNDAAYAADKFYPSRAIWIDPPFVFRDQRIVSVHLSPVLYNPARKVLRYLASGAIRIRTSYGTQGKPAVSPAAKRGSSARLEPLYKSLMLNYEQAREWRVAAAKPAAIRSDSTRDWFIPGRPYYVIPVVADGWYRLTKTDLAMAGVAAGQLDTSTVALWYRGRRVPLMIRPDSSLEFYGLRNHGDSTYYDWYTDTSSYWLTWGSTPGPRYAPASAPGAPATSTVVSALTTLHLEQNTALYQGTTEAELTTSGPIPGKGWVWEYYYPGTQYTHPFTIDSLDQSAPNASIRVRLFSTTPHYQSPDHIAQFWMNDSLLGSLPFDGRTEGMFSKTFPARWLLQGANQLRILSNPPSTSNVNQFYLDWFEIDYQRPLHASSNQLIFTGPASSGAGSASFTVTGFQSPSIDVFDLTDGRWITGGAVSGSAGAGYSVAFKDSFAVSRQYAVVCQGGPLPVLPISQRVLSDIRSNQTGADYIIITQRAFMTAARQLAAFRQATNGLRVSVVDVQDIYDQFNYGMLNVNPIKAFLQYAYTSWPSPAPSYLLMFGDASWDFHRYLSTTVKTNYVPAYGVPGGDNWYACFDPVNTFIPSMLIGRLPVQDTVQAASTVAKIAGYESSAPAQWTKNFLFISGGTTPSEQLEFNSMSDYTVNTYVVAPPVGGYAYTVYKSTPDAIDGEHKQQLQDIVKNGVVFLNFLGHSGGRIWGVDIGSPDDLQNTTGDLPFVSSVSCNVGAFSEPSSNVLSEDFVLADNRGAVAVWSSASLAYADIGSDLVNNFFQGVTVDSVRDFGALTTTARIQLWLTSGSNYITIGSVNLTPLLGDPLSHFALPLKPDLAVGPADLYLNSKIPTPSDSVLALTAIVHNYGLVPADSVTILLTDIYNGVVTPLLNYVRIPPPRIQDSLVVPWRGTKQIGQHTLVLNVDPLGVIGEVTKANNIVSVQEYVYANLLYVVRPLENMLVPPGPQLLRVTSPIGVDSATMQIAFQLDTSATFTSPFLVSSPTINPGPVSAEWTTPALADATLYYWRAKSFSSTISNAWVTSSFRTSSTLPGAPLVRWSESSSGQFLEGATQGTTVTDSGVAISAQLPSHIYARSLGTRADANKDYYSTLQLDDQVMIGLWWIQGNGFLAMRADPVTRTPAFHAFDVPDDVTQSDSMQNFLAGSQAGNFIALSVVFDGRTNVSTGLRNSIKALGSTFIDSVQPGDAWAFIAQVGGGTSPLESWSRLGVAADSVTLQNAYSAGSGTFTGIQLPMPQKWQTFRWSTSGASGTTNARVAIVGIRSTALADTLKVIPRDSSVADLSSLNVVTADPSYVSWRAVSVLSSSDARGTPLLRSWSADFEPPADLAISSHSLSAPKIQIPKGTAGSVTLGVYNIGYRKVDSARVVLSVVQPDNSLQPIAYAEVDSIPVGGEQTVQVPFPTIGLPAQFTIQARVSPPNSAKELIWENNVALYNYVVQTGPPLSAKISVFADGVQLMDGDYVESRPKILVHLYNLTGVGSSPPAVDLFIDNLPVGSPSSPVLGKGERPAIHPLDDPTFMPVLANGAHELRVRVSQLNALGLTDSVIQEVSVNVTDQYKILQMFNYPNPFGSDTWFTFVLTGNAPPDELIVRIYTVAGRKIREIAAPPGSLAIGFNKLYWDGRDADGDQVANGNYLYMLELRGGGKTQTAMGKLSRIR